MDQLEQVRKQWRALHDGAGGVAGAVLAYERLQHALMLARRRPLAVTVLAVSWEVTEGAAVGQDDVDAAVAARVQAAIRDSDTAGWLMPGCLTVLLPSAEDGDAPTVAARLMVRLMEPVDVGGVPVQVRPSAGVTVASRGNADASAEQLLEQAASALRDACELGGGFAAWDSPAARYVLDSIRSAA